MKIIIFKNFPETGTPVPKVMWWYVAEKNKKLDKPICLNAELANELYQNELSLFFKKYPNELYNKVLMSSNGQTNITEEDIKLYKSEVE